MRCPSPERPATFNVPGLGRWTVDHCLWDDLTDQELVELIEAILRFEQDRILPVAGGWFDQSEAFLTAYELWQREMAAYRRQRKR